MNALVSLDSVLEPTVPFNPSTLFGSGQIETIVKAIEQDVRSEAYDIATEDGRERIKSVAYKIARSKTTLDEIGKEHVADIKAKSAAIDKERKALRDRLDALKDEVRGPLTEWETREAERVANHEEVLVWIVQACQFDNPPTASAIKDRIEALDNEARRDWQEFTERAGDATEASRTKLFIMLEAAELAERDAAELAELRRLKAERDEADAKAAWQRAENERMQRAAKEAAERERIRAEQQAERDRQMAERAEREKVAAAARAVEQERQRVAAKEAADKAAQEKREANQRHRAKVHSKITLALSEVLTGNADEAAALIEAIAAGKIPHVSITY